MNEHSASHGKRCPFCGNTVHVTRLDGTAYRFHTHGNLAAGRCSGSGRWMRDQVGEAAGWNNGRRFFLSPHSSAAADARVSERGA